MNKALVFSVLLSLGVSPLFAEQDGPPVDAGTILKTLQVLEEKQTNAKKAMIAKVLSDFNMAAASNASAIKFYEEAIRQTQFVGQNRENTQFQEWKKKQADKLKSNELQTAARLHLQYLALTLQRANGVPMEQLIPALITYTNQLNPVYDMVEKEELMKKSVADGLFARWYGLGKLLGNLKGGWEPLAGNLDGIYAKAILPALREQKDPRVLAYWDARIQREAGKANSDDAKFGQNQFTFVKKPALLWSRAQDQVAIGQKNRGVAEMFALIKTYPDHPDGAAWIKELKGLLAAPAPSAPPEAGAAAQ